ncbi:MAG: acetate--CoA ligase family protein, partial [Phycisphaerales bacterium]|nr:acetate--CoA ligase family protein [Phycisphaerales bacterium]
MARLHEYQGKALLAERGIAVPRGGPASTPQQAAERARALIEDGAEGVVIKIQAWTTGRAAIGGVAFAATPEEAATHATRLLAMKVGAFPVTEVIVEEKIAIAHELFVSLNIDDAARAPVLLLSFSGGSGVEERAGEVHRLPCHPLDGLDSAAVGAALRQSGIEAGFHEALTSLAHAVFRTARETEARSVEINPVAITGDGWVVAADCRMTIDDYAVFRHPELGIDIARELDHPPTRLERIAYAIEQADHRGTFYFAELPRDGGADEMLIGFHGAGGGGSMMSMDAVTREGFTLANFCDTSGNPSVAKVYAAARIILAQPGIIGYFGSGSGVASQEQYHSAYGLAKAFWEMRLPIPAVIRLGGNSEDRAVEILESIAGKVRGTVEGYRK